MRSLRLRPQSSSHWRQGPVQQPPPEHVAFILALKLSSIDKDTTMSDDSNATRLPPSPRHRFLSSHQLNALAIAGTLATGGMIPVAHLAFVLFSFV
ncbi:hypothetical protein Cni_G02111 [Canna indica]|uniref:Uncharacterized protein n=1 Tax=Canna indica TaxID=4628 RepID=A0AAQ3Q1Y4_9LILI|nr:hypothetical protein Cni_G02111 [Canna indica]